VTAPILPCCNGLGGRWPEHMSWCDVPLRQRRENAALDALNGRPGEYVAYVARL
jgi:hypothetical protein